MEKENRDNFIDNVEGEKNTEFLEFKQMIAELQNKAEEMKRDGIDYKMTDYQLRPNDLTIDDFDIYRKWQSGNLPERELEEYLKDLGFDDKKYPFAHWLVGGIQRDWH